MFSELVIFPTEIFTHLQKFVYNEVAAFLFVILQIESTSMFKN